MATKSFQIEEIDSIGHCSLSTIQRITADSKISSESKLSSEPAEVSEKKPNEVVLKRHLGLFSGTCFIVGIIIGSGIFVSPKSVLRHTESIGLCLVVWVGCGLVSLLGALCYAEIGTIIPRNGAEASYMREGIGSVHFRIGDILGFLFIWANTFILKPSSIAILTLTFSQYFLSGILPGCDPPEEMVKLCAILTLLILININSFSVRAANSLSIIFTVSKLTTISTIIIVGIVRLCTGHTTNMKMGFIGTTKSPFRVASAFYSGLWAYDGWNILNSVTEELKNPKRDLSLSIALSLPIIIFLYVMTNVSYFTVLSPSELLASSAVAMSWARVALGPVARFLPILISFSALGSSNNSLFSAARYCMVGSQYGYLPAIFSYIHKSRLTPAPGICLQGFLAILYCIPSNIDTLIDFFSFSSWIFYGLSFVATICCKFTMKNASRVISVPIPLVIAIVLVSIYLVFAPVIAEPSFGFLIALLLILFGLIFYYPFVYRKIEMKFITRINQSIGNFFQLKLAQVQI